MKAFLFEKIDNSEWEFRGKVVTEFPPLIIIAKDEATAWYLLDKHEESCYGYNLINEITNETLIYAIQVINLHKPNNKNGCMNNLLLKIRWFFFPKTKPSVYDMLQKAREKHQSIKKEL
jgi:hypothetical protein